MSKHDKAIAKIKDVMPKGAKARKLNYKEVEGFYFNKLCKECKSHKEVSELLGLTQSAISSILRKKKVRVVNELAAKAVFLELYDESSLRKSSKVMAIIKADPHIIKTIEDMLKSLDGNIWLLKDSVKE